MVHSDVARSAGSAVTLMHGQLQPAERRMRNQNGLILDALLQSPGWKARTHTDGGVAACIASAELFYSSFF